METIRRFIKYQPTEDQMDVDLDFTERYLSQYETIDRETIDVLIDNGYQNKDQLLALDIKEDLPLLPTLNMGQKSLLRKVLQHFQSAEDFESKVADVTADSIDVMPPTPTNKRKLDYTLSPFSSSSPKRTRTSMASTSRVIISPTNDGLGPQMRQMIRGRKSIRSKNSSESEDDIPQLNPIVDTKRFNFGKTGNGFGIKSEPQEYDDDEEEEEEEEEVPKRSFGNRSNTRLSGCPKVGQRASLGGRPRLFGRKSVGGAPPRTPFLNETFSSPRPKRTSTAGSKTTPKQNSPTKHIPTPTEIELRERLEKKKAEPKNTRKRGSRK